MLAPEISILLGARQVGKSTLMHHLEAEARRQNLTTAYFDLEQTADMERLAGNDVAVITTLVASARVVFIDEFHYLKNASKIFKAIHDSKKPIKIFASGSSSMEIHRHLKESLAGRFNKTMIFPMTVDEWRQLPSFQEEEFLQWGGMPGLVNKADPNERAEALQNVVSAYVTKDIKALIQEENVRAFNSLLYLLAQWQGSLVTVSGLARKTGLNESTVARHLEIMTQTYVLHPIVSYSQNMANELKKSKKYYLFDLGIRNALLKDYRPAPEREDKGALYESAVLHQLIPQLKANAEIRFWRTKKGQEVDFILLKNRVPVPVEVKSGLRAPLVPDGMAAFLSRYPKAPFGVVYNESVEAETVFDKRPVYFWKWSRAAPMDYLQSVL